MYCEQENNKKVLYIVIDCEGMFNTKRTLEEETKLALVCSAVSDLTIFSTTNNFDRVFEEFFRRLSKLINFLKGERLFNKSLLILVRDLDRNSMYNALNEF